jgi:hypothetical protein
VREAVKGAKAGDEPVLGLRLADELKRKRVLDAAQRAVVYVRALQDLVTGDEMKIVHCNDAVRDIEKIEERVKHGDKVPGVMEVIWCIRDAAADLGGLEVMLDEIGDVMSAIDARRALAALKPLHDRFKIANARVDRCAAVCRQPTHDAGRPGSKQKKGQATRQ